jgi:hypothetical protein
MKAPTLEQLSSSTNVGFTSGSTLPPPLIPSSYKNNNPATTAFNTNNPFMRIKKPKLCFFFLTTFSTNFPLKKLTKFFFF